MNIQDYKNVFVFAEQRNGVIQPVAFELLGKARDLADALGEKVVAMLLGYNVKEQAQTLIEMGADEVIVADCPELKDYITEQYSQAAYQVITERKPTIVLYGATTIGRDLAPRIAHAVLPIKGKRDSGWGYSWIPVAGPIVGAILAALTYLVLY